MVIHLIAAACVYPAANQINPLRYVKISI